MMISEIQKKKLNLHPVIGWLKGEEGLKMKPMANQKGAGEG